MKTLRQALSELKDASIEQLRQASFSGLSPDLIKHYESKGYHYYQGKVRELVISEDSMWMIHSDRLSAFDRYIGLVPYKGIILNELSKFWLEKAQQVCPSHLIRPCNERILEVERCEPIKAEVIVRGYLAGSMMRAYQKGERSFCGLTLEDGLEAFAPLKKPIITPTKKAAAFEHDEDSSAEELIAEGICSEAEWQQISEMALQLFALGQEVYAQKSWILVDTKYEFGRRKDGSLVVIDEIHTPDSSRLWEMESYHERLAHAQAPKMLDKENVRRYLLEQGFQGQGEVPEVPAHVLVELAQVYLDVAEKLIGEDLVIRNSEYRID